MATIVSVEPLIDRPRFRADRRRCKRHPVALPIIVLRASENMAKQGTIIDLSETGARAAINAELFVGECVQLQVVAGVTMTGIVRHKRFSTYGLEFTK